MKACLRRSLAVVWIGVLSAGPLLAQVRISEFLAVNVRTLADTDGEFSDWIELENTGSESVSLAGWSLSDDPADLARWTFPDVELAPGAFLVVFASGVSRRLPDAELHTGFRLSSDGEFLALVDPAGTVVDAYPEPPAQFADVSYGVAPDGMRGVFFGEPTPGAANGKASLGVLEPPAADRDRGFYEQPFEVMLTSQEPDVTIRYTVDGNTPDLENGVSFDSPLNVGTTTVLRARSFREGYLPSRTITHTYLFVSDVALQDNAPPGYPTQWKADSGGTLPADYEMDPQITENPRYAELLDDSLLAVPTISLVTDIGHLFSEQNGIYQFPQMQGFLSERPVSVEWLYPDGRRGTQIDAGIRIQGGASRLPSKSPKHSFRLAFRRRYGAGTLRFPVFERGSSTEEFDTIILRAGFNQSWIHHNTSLGDQRGRGQYIRDQWMKDTQRAMGQISPHNDYAHVYLNGLYWGLYNPTERPEAWFAAAYLGGVPEDYDTTNSGAAVDGSIASYNGVLALSRDSLTNPASYAELLERVDRDSLMDYMILNQYAGNMDWDGHNWYAVLGRAGGQLHYVSWDAESIFLGLSDSRISLNDARGPSGLFKRFMAHSDFARDFADRVQRHFFGDGALTLPAVIERWERRSRRIVEAVVAESARWGDYRRDVHRSGSPLALLERDVHWQRERTRLLESYFPQRGPILLNQYRQSRYYPGVEAPQISPPERTLAAPTAVTVSATVGTVYYTTDGSDPRLEDDRVASQAIEGEPGAEVLLLGLGTEARYLVPQDGRLHDTWYRDDFDDSQWTQGPMGIGFGTHADLAPLIGTNVEAEMKGLRTSIYVRLRVPLDEVPEIDSLLLRMRYDDGFVAFLNGREVARVGAPEDLAWDGKATRIRTNRQASTPADVVLDTNAGILREGENVLAFQVFNRSLTGPDLLVAAELVGRKHAEARFDLSTTSLVRARTRSGEEWSALSERLFSTAAGLRVSEIHYHPALDGELEFIEFTNVARSTLDLTGVRFTSGIEYEFPDSSLLPPGAVMVLARDRTAFETQYGVVAALAGEYRGSLDNAGEAIRIVGQLEDDVLVDLAYKDHWYPTSDGGGRSLVAVEPAATVDAFSLRESWTPSAEDGGSPGVDTSPGAPQRGMQRIGDANQDGRIDLTDALQLIRLIVGDPDVALPCRGAVSSDGNTAVLDVNADESLDLTDALYVLNHLFQRGRAPVGGAGCVRVSGCEDVCLR